MTGRGAWLWWGLATVVACLLVNPYVRGDGNGYYAWLVSPVIDGDLDFTNQFERADPLFRGLVFAADGVVRPEIVTSTGRVGNQWSVGPAVVWAPFFLAAHAGVGLARLAGATVPADGYSWPYLWSVSLGTVLYGMLALWLSARTAIAMGYQRGTAVAVIGIGLASSLPVYQIFLPFHVHALAACAVAAFVWWGLTRHASHRVRDWAIWGGLAGLMVQVYHLNLILVVVAVVVWLPLVRRDGLSRALRAGGVFTAAAVLMCAPQLVGKWLVYGRPWITGYQDQFIWTEPRLWETALSANHGWLLWTPIVACALVGLVRVWRGHPPARALVAAVPLLFLVVASYQNWHGQSSFGNRFFLSLTVVLVLGLAALAEAVRARGAGPWRALVVVVATLVVWNVGFAFQWGTNIIPNRGPVSLRQVAVNQVTVVPSRLGAFVWRYVSDRRGVQEAVERGDVLERRDYRVVR